MRRVLIVSPHFPPVNAPDHQRVRMSLPYLAEFGWEATVLAVSPLYVEGAVLDPLLERSLPADVEIVRVDATPIAWTRRVGLGNLGIRAFRRMWIAGSTLLKSRPFDVIFFSTTVFPVLLLGPLWKRRFGVPYVVDFQDPWLDDPYARSGTTPPGGRTRYAASQAVAKLAEPRVMRDVSQIICVSPAYVETLRERYPTLTPDQFAVIPFAASERDFDLLEASEVRQSIFDPTDGNQHWIYVGRGGQDMRHAITIFCQALAALRRAEPQRWQKLRVHFVGTSYAPKGMGEETIRPIAETAGVGDLVTEQTARVAYFEALRLLRDANALLVIGSETPGYSASKLYPYMMADRPMLAILNKDSPAVEILARCGAGTVVTFQTGKVESGERLAAAMDELYHRAFAGDKAPEIDREQLARYGAREMTRR